MKIKQFLIGIILGSLVATATAQVTTNNAIYGWMLSSNVGTFLSTPTTANFAAAVTGETGTGAVVFGTNPTISLTPVAVTSLASCGAGTANNIAIVNDALAPALGVAVGNGGALTVGVICKNGTGWIVY